MELIDVRDALRRWSVLIIATTLVAALIGYRVALRSREAARPHYVGTAGVVLHYVTPPGVAYITTLSPHTQADVLSARVTEPGVLPGVAARAHVALVQVQGVSAAVDPQKPVITVQALGATPRAVAAIAQGLAQYLAGVETQQVQAQTAILSRTAASALAQAQQRWLAAQTHYYLVCGCIAGQHQATVDPATLAQLRAELDLLQATYAAAASRHTALQDNPVPVATVTPGSVSAVHTRATSPLKAVLLAAVVGLLVSSTLAALLDSRRSGPATPADARGPVQAARSQWPAVRSQWSVARSRWSVARTQQPVKVVLPAAGLGLLVCIGLTGSWLLAPGTWLAVASHVGARRVRLEESRQSRAAAPPALVLNPDAVHFGRQDGPTRGAAQTIYVVNVGPAPVTITTITVTGPDGAAFAEADTCTHGAIGMYAGCTISVRVAPMARCARPRIRRCTPDPPRRQRTTGTETRQATLVITASASGSLRRVPLSA